MKLCKSISGLSKVSKTLRCQSFVGCLAEALYLNLHFSQWDWDVPGDPQVLLVTIILHDLFPSFLLHCSLLLEIF